MAATTTSTLRYITTVTRCTLICKIKSSSSVLQSQQSLGSDVKGAVIKCDFNSRLNSFESAVLRIVAGNVFHATGPQTENTCSLSLVRVLDMTNVGHVDDWRHWR